MNSAYMYRWISSNFRQQPIEVRCRGAFKDYCTRLKSAAQTNCIPRWIARIHSRQLMLRNQPRVMPCSDRPARRCTTKLGQGDNVRIPFQYLLDNLAGAPAAAMIVCSKTQFAQRSPRHLRTQRMRMTRRRHLIRYRTPIRRLFQRGLKLRLRLGESLRRHNQLRSRHRHHFGGVHHALMPDRSATCSNHAPAMPGRSAWPRSPSAACCKARASSYLPYRSSPETPFRCHCSARHRRSAAGSPSPHRRHSDPPTS